MGLGGVLVFVLDYDDFRDECGCETYPLLKTINRVFEEENSSNVTTKCSLFNHISPHVSGP
jgi:chitinase